VKNKMHKEEKQEITIMFRTAPISSSQRGNHWSGELTRKSQKEIGEAVTEVLGYKPANIYVRRIIRPIYIPLNRCPSVSLRKWWAGSFGLQS